LHLEHGSGGRCIRLAYGQNAFLSQHRTDPRLGDVGRTILNGRGSAKEALQAVVDSGAEFDWRQLAALGPHSNCAVYHGKEIYSVYNHSAGRNCLAIGNILDNKHVTEAMRDAFETAKVALFRASFAVFRSSWRPGGGI